ncbi:MAG: Gfo/Idh/MocA family oxidoreductase [Planctomycetes bacterium]|nr:Gfo/Idh/MocA family oxidoreductase [Planctomycetota bacterium]
MSEKIRFGMIGAGAISNAHLGALAARDDVEIVCIADKNLDRAKAQAEKYGIGRAVGEYEELVAMDDIQAVVVGIPTQFHPDASTKAMAKGKHVLCEKPMARTLRECDEMADAAETNGVVLAIGFVRRFDPDWGKVRELVQANKVGRPCMWRRIVAGAAPGPPNYGAWYSDSRFSNGPLDESGSHDFDFVRYTFGDAKAVTASTWKMGRAGDVLDTCTLIVDFKSGDQMLCLWSWGLPKGCRAPNLGPDVLGPDGVIHGPEKEEGENEFSYVVVGPEGAEERHPFTLVRTGKFWSQGQMDNFVESIRGNETPRATAEDGRKTQEIVLAAFEATKTGRRVEIGEFAGRA